MHDRNSSLECSSPNLFKSGKLLSKIGISVLNVDLIVTMKEQWQLLNQTSFSKTKGLPKRFRLETFENFSSVRCIVGKHWKSMKFDSKTGCAEYYSVNSIPRTDVPYIRAKAD